MADPYTALWAPPEVKIRLGVPAIDFRQLVLETYILFFPKIQSFDILFNPRLGIQLCDLVRMRLQEPALPDSLILQTLFVESQGRAP